MLASCKIRTWEDLYWVDVEGDIENVNNILKITEIRTDFHIRVSKDKQGEAKSAFGSYLAHCPAAQSVIGCIGIKDRLIFEDEI